MQKDERISSRIIKLRTTNLPLLSYFVSSLRGGRKPSFGRLAMNLNKCKGNGWNYFSRRIVGFVAINNRESRADKIRESTENRSLVLKITDMASN